MLQSLEAFGLAALPFLLGVLPSVIVGLTPYPKAAGIASTALKLLNMLSLLTHSDSPGTLKMPMTMSKNPNGMLEKTGPTGLVSLLLLASVFGLTLPGCACSDPANKAKLGCKVEQGLIDCSTAAAGQAMQAALQDVEAAISGSEIDWMALARAEGTYGIGVVACVIEKLDNAPAASTDALSAMKHVNVHENAKTYYAARRVKFR